MPKMISQSALQPGDIILSAADGWIHHSSAAIRLATWSNLSHAALYVGGPEGYVVEAVGEGVRKLALCSALADDTVAIAYTRFGINPALAGSAVLFAMAQLGKAYNYAGALAAGSSTPAGKVLRLATSGTSDAALAACSLYSSCASKTWFCAELVTAAYEWIAMPIIPKSASQSTAALISESHVLACLGQLK